MGRFLFLIIIIVAALAGVWFYMPGGKDMLMGAKDKAMHMMPGAKEEAAPAPVVVEEPAVDTMAEEPMVEETPMDDHSPTEEPAPQR